MKIKSKRPFPPPVGSDFWTIHPSPREWKVRRWRVESHEPGIMEPKFNSREVRCHDGAALASPDFLHSMDNISMFREPDGWGNEFQFVFAGHGIGVTTLAVFPTWAAADTERRAQIADLIRSHEESANLLRTWNP